jgi:hypothetical protein
MKNILLFLVLMVIGANVYGQISFFNMPNPDMLPDIGYAYVEYDRYQSLKGTDAVNASVFRFSTQVTPFLEVGANTWFNSDNPQDPNRIVIATKWKMKLFQKGHFNMTMSPGNWSSVYFNGTSMKNIVYNFVGLNHEEGPKSYTRIMFGGYGKHWNAAPEFGQKEMTYGMIAGFEHRFNDYIEFVADYFQGSGEGFGLAMGVVAYPLEKGHNLPIYIAYQFDNDSRENDLLLMQIGYFFRAFSSNKK